MRYIQTNKGIFVRHIFNEFEIIKWDESHKTSVRKLPEDKRVEFGISRLQMVTPPACDRASQTRSEVDAVLIEGVWTQSWLVTDLEGDELAAAQLEGEDTDTKNSKFTGIEILGVMCSATGKDQDKLAAVAIGVLLIRAKGEKFPASVFEFKNGNELVITDENFDVIYPIWFNFRQSFFPVK